MTGSKNKTRKRTRRRALPGMFGIVLVLALAFGGWLYKAKTQRDLNRQLISAIRKSDTAAAIRLLAHGADPNARDIPQEKLSLWQQMQRAFRQDTELRDDQFPTVLEMATDPVGMSYLEDGDVFTNSENVPLIKALLKAGAHPDVSSRSNGLTPLMIAIQYGCITSVQLLLDHGANPLARDHDGDLPIHLTTDPKIAELLLEHGNDVNAVDNDAVTPLMESAADGNVGIVLFLLAHGARIDSIDKAGNSVLICSLQQMDDHPEVVKVLIAHGADVNHHNKAGKTALSLAEKHNYPKTVRLLVAAGAKL